MPDTYVLLPDGKKLRHRQRTQGTDQVLEQYVVAGAMPTYYYWTGYLAGAANKVWFDIFNAVGSGRVLKVKKVFVQSNLAAQTGAQSLFDFQRTSSVGSGGTALTPAKMDTADENVPAQITARTGATGGAAVVTPTLFGYPGWSEETAAPAALMGMVAANPEGPEIKELTLREGEGFAVRQPTAGAGSWGVLAVVTTELP